MDPYPDFHEIDRFAREPSARVRVTRGPLQGCSCVLVSQPAAARALVMVDAGVYVALPWDALEPENLPR
jgi:hypothetical protein